MNPQDLIDCTVDYVKAKLKDAESGHDWWHALRVWKLAQQINIHEPGDSLVVQLGALLHDIADPKFHHGNEEIARSMVSDFLVAQNVSDSLRTHVIQIIDHISFKGGNVAQTFRSPELDIVQDADRLDAIGAIGIARTFNYGGFRNRELYNPDIAPKMDMTKEEYRHSTAPTLNHFYEKLLLLKDRMNTPTARRLAVQRHRFMELFLNEFLEEWEGQR